MNKIIMKCCFAAFSAMFALGLGSCTEECDYTPAQPVDANCIKASFVAEENGMFTEVAPTEEKKLTFTLTRENDSKEATVALEVLQNEEEMFDIPETVSFAAGEKQKTFDITFPNVEIGMVYEYSIGLKEMDIDPYQETTTATLTGQVQMVQWDAIGKGSLSVTLLGGTASCNVYKASHAVWYKVVAPVEEGMDLVFKVNEANEVTVDAQAIFTHSNYGTVYVVSQAGVYNAQANIIQVALKYYCSAGTFGTFVETLTLPAN